MKKYDEVVEHVKKSKITRYIMNMDCTLEVDDIVNEVYLKIYDKDLQFIHNCIKQSLLNLYKKYKIRQDRKCGLCVDDMELEDVYDIESTSFMNVILEVIKQQDVVIYKCLYYYFVENMTYKEIAPIVNISFRGVKDKIDKGLEIIRNM